MASQVFTSRKILPDTFVISGKGCDSYLLLGVGQGMMIDSGMAKEDIRGFAEKIAGMPVPYVINTHSHFDHTAGNGFFDVIYGTEGIARSAKNTMGADPIAYRLGYSFATVHDGQILDLPGRRLEVIVLDCHAPGSLCVLDHTRRILFPGDELECGQVLLLPGYAEQMGQVHAKPAASVESYLHAMERLFERQAEFDLICPSHNGTPIHKSYLDAYITLAKKILDGYVGSEDCSSATFRDTAKHFPLPGAGYRRAEWGGASLVYQEKLIWDGDYDKAEALPPATTLHLISKDSAYEG